MKKIILFVPVVALMFFASCSNKCAECPAQANDIMQMTFQRGAFPYTAYDGMQDAYINSGATGATGDAQYMKLGNQSGEYKRILMRFDVSSIAPSSAQVVKAYLTLFVGGIVIAAPPMAAYELQSVFLQTSATWNERFSGVPWTYGGADYNSRVSDIVAASIDSTFVTLTLSNALVQSWINSAYNNRGLIIIAQNEGVSDGECDILSSEISVITGRPKLTIYYRLP